MFQTKKKIQRSAKNNVEIDIALSLSLFSRKNVFLLLKLYDQVCRIFQDGWNWQASSSLSYLPSDQVTFLECVFFFCFLLENFKLVIWCYVVVVIPLISNSKRSLTYFFTKDGNLFWLPAKRDETDTDYWARNPLKITRKLVITITYVLIAQYQKFETSLTMYWISILVLDFRVFFTRKKLFDH